MTPERIGEIKRMMEEEYAREYEPWSVRFIVNAAQAVADLLVALEESQQEAHKQNEEAKRLNEICKQLAGEEMMFQDGKYETEMQRLESKLAEAQQTIARQQEAMDRASDMMNYRHPAYGLLQEVLLTATEKEGS